MISNYTAELLQYFITVVVFGLICVLLLHFSILSCIISLCIN